MLHVQVFDFVPPPQLTEHPVSLHTLFATQSTGVGAGTGGAVTGATGDAPGDDPPDDPGDDPPDELDPSVGSQYESSSVRRDPDRSTISAGHFTRRTCVNGLSAFSNHPKRNSHPACSSDGRPAHSDRLLRPP